MTSLKIAIPVICLVLIDTSILAEPWRQPVASVGSVKISRGTLDAAVQQKVKQESYHKSPSPARLAQLESEVLEALIRDELLFQEARRIGVKATASQVDEMVRKQAARVGGDERLAQMLEQSGRSQAELRQLLEKQILVQNLIDASYVEKPRDQLLAEAREYFRANATKYMKPTSVQLRHLLVKIDPSRISESRRQAEQQAKELVEKLRSGASFEELSKDASNVDFKDLGWVHLGSLMPEVEEAIKKTATGAISDPVRSTFGFHVVQVLARREPEPVSFEQVQEAVLAELRQSLRDKEIAHLLEACRRRWPVEIYLGAAGGR